MPTKANRAIGSLDFSDSERKTLAIKSRSWRCENCGLIKDLLRHPDDGSKCNDKNNDKNNDVTQLGVEGLSVEFVDDRVSSKTETIRSCDSNSREPLDVQSKSSQVTESQNDHIEQSDFRNGNNASANHQIYSPFVLKLIVILLLSLLVRRIIVRILSI